MQYRPEIDGLRAVSVMAVIFCHAGVEAIGGGFLGVDVFFVISGFLITSLIVRDLERGTFSIIDFYDRRLRRIIPALVAVMILSSIAAYLLLLPDDLENYGQSVVATSLFANNVLLWMTSGYFSLEAEFKPLTHTWSLAVEEQYYVVVPLLFAAVFARFRQRGLMVVSLLISVASFSFAVWASEAMPVANFLLIMSRAWELGLGGIAALASPRLRDAARRSGALGPALAALGLAMVVVPLFVYDETWALPSWPSLVPVLGACLVLIYGDASSGIGRVLSAKPFVMLGLISYSAYLYHQPVFAFTRVSRLTEPDLWLMLSLIPPILLMSWASWRYVEQPFRDRNALSLPKVGAILGTTSAAVAAFGFAMHMTAGFPERSVEIAKDEGFAGRRLAAYSYRAHDYMDQPFGAASEKVRVLVIGNSFARDFTNVLLETPVREGFDISFSARRPCANDGLSMVEEEIVKAAEFVVFGSGVSEENLGCVLEGLEWYGAQTEAELVVLGLKNFGWNNNALMLLPPEERYEFRVEPLDATVESNAFAASRIPADLYVDLLQTLGDDDGRVPVFTPDQKIISQDRVHLTRAGAAFMSGVLQSHPVLEPLFQAGASQCCSDQAAAPGQ